VASIANVAAKGTGVSLVTGGVRSDLVKSLKRGSPRIMKIVNDFKKFTGTIKIYSFTEQDAIRGKNSLVGVPFLFSPKIWGKALFRMFANQFALKTVSPESAIMGHAGEVPIEMPGCNHKTICRFESENSMPYQRVLGILQEVAEEITNS
jgi:hypothetical protein